MPLDLLAVCLKAAYHLQDRKWMTFGLDHLDSVYYLCYFAMMQDLEPQLTKWMRVTVSEADVRTSHAVQHLRAIWRSHLFRMSIHARLALNPGNSDTAIQYLFDIMYGEDALPSDLAAFRIHPRSFLIASRLLWHLSR